MDSAQIKTEVWTPKSPEFELGPAITEAINIRAITIRNQFIFLKPSLNLPRKSLLNYA